MTPGIDPAPQTKTGYPEELTARFSNSNILYTPYDECEIGRYVFHNFGEIIYDQEHSVLSHFVQEDDSSNVTRIGLPQGIKKVTRKRVEEEMKKGSTFYVPWKEKGKFDAAKYVVYIQCPSINIREWRQNNGYYVSIYSIITISIPILHKHSFAPEVRSDHLILRTYKGQEETDLGLEADRLLEEIKKRTTVRIEKHDLARLMVYFNITPREEPLK